MKYKYCPRCKKAYIRSRLEKDECIYCNGKCETVNVKRNGLYYLGYGIMIAGAACAFIPRVIAVSDEMPYWVLGLALAGAGAVIVMMGSMKMAQAAVDMLKEKEDS